MADPKYPDVSGPSFAYLGRFRRPEYLEAGHNRTLSTEARKSLPKKSFAVPGKRPGSGSYPIPDEAHARNALARVSQHGSPAEQARVRAAVRRKFPGIEQSKGKK
jgi:hypothetical protein